MQRVVTLRRILICLGTAIVLTVTAYAEPGAIEPDRTPQSTRAHAKNSVECGRYRVTGKLQKARSGAQIALIGKKERLNVSGLGESELNLHKGRVVSLEVDIAHSASLAKVDAKAVFGSLKRIAKTTKPKKGLQLLQRDRCQ